MRKRKIMIEINKKIKIELFNDHFQNFKNKNIPKAQLVIADIPYNLGKNAYGSSTEWYVGGENKNGESDKAGKQFFDTDNDFRIAEYMHFCSRLLKPESKENNIVLSWEKEDAFCMLRVNLDNYFAVISYLDKNGEIIELDI